MEYWERWDAALSPLRAGWCGEEGTVSAAMTRGNPEPEAGADRPRDRVDGEEDLSVPLESWVRIHPKTVTAGRLNIGPNKSIFCLASRILLLGKEVSLTEMLEPRVGKQLVQGDSAVSGEAGFLSIHCCLQQQIITPCCSIQGLACPGLSLPFWLQILLVALP